MENDPNDSTQTVAQMSHKILRGQLVAVYDGSSIYPPRVSIFARGL